MRKISEIAREIRSIWGSKVYFGAVPYLEAMLTLNTTDDDYGDDPGHKIVRYFLGNAQTFRGPDAKRLKDELKLHLK